MAVPHERIDDLMCNGLKLIQDPSLFCFGMDAVLLSSFVRASENDSLLDLGCGNGILPVLLSGKTKARRIAGLELEQKSAALAARNVRLNGLEDRVEIINGDVREADRFFPAASFHVVTANPPYYAAGSGFENPSGERAAARHEIHGTFEDFVKAAAHVLKSSGHFYLVHRPSRLPELFGTLKQHHLEPKKMRLVYPYADEAPTMVLLDCVKGAGPELKTDPPFIVYREPGKYTNELLEAYGMKEDAADE